MSGNDNSVLEQEVIAQMPVAYVFGMCSCCAAISSVNCRFIINYASLSSAGDLISCLFVFVF